MGGCHHLQGAGDIVQLAARRVSVPVVHGQLHILSSVDDFRRRRLHKVAEFNTWRTFKLNLTHGELLSSADNNDSTSIRRSLIPVRRRSTTLRLSFGVEL